MLNWEEVEEDTINATGYGKRSYTVFNEGHQYIVEVDGVPFGYGDFEDCKNQAEEHNNACRRK